MMLRKKFVETPPKSWVPQCTHREAKRRVAVGGPHRLGGLAPEGGWAQRVWDDARLAGDAVGRLERLGAAHGGGRLRRHLVIGRDDCAGGELAVRQVVPTPSRKRRDALKPPAGVALAAKFLEAHACSQYVMLVP